MIENIIIIVIGMLTGLASGMFGIGGSVVATPLLILLAGISSRYAVSSPLPAVIASAIAGSITYNLKGIVKRDIVLYTVLTGIPFGFLGSYVNNIFDVNLVILAKALVLFILSMRFLFKKKNLEISKYAQNERNILLLTGIVGGFIAGFVAIGGGVVYVAAYNLILKKDMTTASANSLVAVGITAVFNTIIHYTNGYIDLNISALIAVGIIPMAIVGAKLNMITSNRKLELSFGIVMLVFSIAFILSRII